MATSRRSSENSTNTALGASETYTGEWVDLGDDFGAISINAASDQAGTLYADFSMDGTTTLENYRIVQLSSGTDGTWGIHDLIRVAQYFRVRVVNGATPQTTMSVETWLSSTPLISIATSRAAQTINDYSDVLNVRILTDPLLDEARGKQSDRSVIQKFGRNPDVGAGTVEDIWYGGGAYSGFLTAAAAVRIKAAGNTNDASGGSGARSVTISGLDQTWADASETVTCNVDGTAVSSPTTTTFIRIFRAYVETCGTYTAANTGDITIETTAGAIVATIQAAKGQTEQAIYTIPLGKVGFIRRIGASVDGTKPADVNFYQRQNADDVTAPYTARRLFFSFAQLTGAVSESLQSYIGPFPAKTDVWASAVGPTGGAGIGADFDIVLVNA